VVEVLRAWDGTLAPDSAGAAIIEGVYRELARDLLERIGGLAGRRVIGESPAGVATQSSFDYRIQGWVVDQVGSPRKPAFASEAERDRALRGALVRTIERLAIEQGDDATAWAWGADHRLRFDHPLGGVPLIGSAFSRDSRPAGGDVNTVWQISATVSLDRESRTVAPSYRQVIDLGDFDRSTFQLGSGVSGIPGHPRYDDCIDEYLEGRTRPMLFTRAAIEAAAEATLTIAPTLAIEPTGARGGRGPETAA
jgi:penicillin amidase